MPRNIWVQRFIAVLDALAIGFVVDRLSPTPLYGLASAAFSLIVLLLMINNKPLSERFLKLDHEAALLLRTVLLSLAFFFLCATAAFLIVS